MTKFQTSGQFGPYLTKKLQTQDRPWFYFYSMSCFCTSGDDTVCNFTNWSLVEDCRQELQYRQASSSQILALRHGECSSGRVLVGNPFLAYLVHQQIVCGSQLESERGNIINKSVREYDHLWDQFVTVHFRETSISRISSSFNKFSSRNSSYFFFSACSYQSYLGHRYQTS